MARRDGIDLGRAPDRRRRPDRRLPRRDARCRAAAVRSPAAPLTLDPLGVRLFVGAAAAARGCTAEPSPRRRRAAAPGARRRPRIAIERVTPELDGGRFPVKRDRRRRADRSRPTSSPTATTSSRAAVRYRAKDETDWREAPMAFVDNDRWAGSFPLTRNTRYRLHGRGLARPVRLLAARARQEARRRRSRSTLELVEGRRWSSRPRRRRDGRRRGPRSRALLARSSSSAPGRPGLADRRACWARTCAR